MSDTLRPGAYDGHSMFPAADYSCAGDVLVTVPHFIGPEPERGVEVDCWFVLPDEPGEAGRG